MRKLISVLYAFLLLIAFSSPALAATFESVEVVAKPRISGGIINFRITYVSDTQIDISWGYTGDAVKIMIRAKYGGYPENIPDEDTTPSDGYLVYYGNGVQTTDTSMNFDQNPGPLYYRAWAQRANGKWHRTVVEDSKESDVMTLIAFLVLALGFTVPAFIARKAWLAFAGAGGWMIFAVYCYTKSVTPTTGNWDVYFAAFFLGCGLVLVCMLEPAIMREPKKDKGEDLTLNEVDQVDQLESDMQSLYRQTRIPRLRSGRRGKSARRAGPQY